MLITLTVDGRCALPDFLPSCHRLTNINLLLLHARSDLSITQPVGHSQHALTVPTSLCSRGHAVLQPLCVAQYTINPMAHTTTWTPLAGIQHFVSPACKAAPTHQVYTPTEATALHQYASTSKRATHEFQVTCATAQCSKCATHPGSKLSWGMSRLGHVLRTWYE
jgi:hypothetical protein